MLRKKLSLAIALSVACAMAVAPATATGSGLYEYRVPKRTDLNADAQLLLNKGFDLLEEGEGGAALRVLGTSAERDRLTSLGFTPSVVRTVKPTLWEAPEPGDLTFYGGYQTVAGQYTHFDDVARRYPKLAVPVKYGQSWKKINGQGGHDLRAICITRVSSRADCSSQPHAPKPRFLLMAGVHSREIAAGEVAYRFIDKLVQGYGTDRQITDLLNTTEFWVVPVANPDGLDLVQAGGEAPHFHRKNANDTHGADCGTPANPGAPHVGVDLNRNSSFQWNTGGSSPDPCSPAFHGPSAGSEPETVAFESLLRKLYPDTRGTGLTDAAAPNTRGMFISMHSDTRMVLFPWAWSTDHSPNDASLRAIAGEIATATGYRHGQVNELLYQASGGNDDWAYGELGVPSWTIEVGDPVDNTCNGFFPAYSCMTDSYVPLLVPALLNAARHAKAPYQVTG